MRKVFHLLTLAAVLLTPSVNGYSQTPMTTTTTSAAMTDAKTTRMSVTSATGFTASNSFTGADYGVFVDHEFMRIKAVSGAVITVERGYSQTNATPHKSGARVYVGPFASQAGAAPGQTGGPFIQGPMVGACTRANYPILPLININVRAASNNTYLMYNCLNGAWRPQTMNADVEDVPLIQACNIAIGSVAYASVGTNTTDVADKMLRTSIYVPQTQYVTGIQVLQGGTATTDKITAALFDAGGVLVAPSAAAGVSLSGANTFLSLPFQTAQLVTGPARYFIGVTGNGTAAGAVRTVAASTFVNVLSGSATGQTFGTFPNFTAPTTFTADLAPVSCLYN